MLVLLNRNKTLIMKFIFKNFISNRKKLMKIQIKSKTISVMFPGQVKKN